MISHKHEVIKKPHGRGAAYDEIVNQRHSLELTWSTRVCARGEQRRVDRR